MMCWKCRFDSGLCGTSSRTSIACTVAGKADAFGFSLRNVQQSDSPHVENKFAARELQLK